MTQDSVGERGKDPVINLADLELQGFGHGHEGAGMGRAHPTYEARLSVIGPRVGARLLGYTLVVLPPGKRGWPLHSHRVNEEMFLILEGAGEVRIGVDSPPRPVRAGDIIACPPGGPETAHQIINTSADAELRYLAVSTKMTPEIADYPEQGVLGIFHAPPGQAVTRFIVRDGESLPYWQDE